MTAVDVITGLPERLYSPIRDRPVSSLVFFIFFLFPAIFFWSRIPAELHWIAGIPAAGVVLALSPACGRSR